jgi:hypothetical protein
MRGGVSMLAHPSPLFSPSSVCREPSACAGPGRRRRVGQWPLVMTTQHGVPWLARTRLPNLVARMWKSPRCRECCVEAP